LFIPPAAFSGSFPAGKPAPILTEHLLQLFYYEAVKPIFPTVSGVII
jgi:hypothetical protein